MAAEPTDPRGDMLVGPLVVRGERLVIGAPKDAGKSTLIACLVRAAVNGDSFLGWQGVGGCRVLMVDVEQGPRALRRTVNAYGLGDTPNVDILSVPGGLELARSDVDRRQLEEIVAEAAPDILVLDPLYKAHLADTNDPLEGMRLMRTLDALREGKNLALVMAAHCRKPPPGGRRRLSIDDISGAGTLVYGAEVILGLEKVVYGRSVLHVWADRLGGLGQETSILMRFEHGRGFWRDVLREDPERSTDIVAAVLAAVGSRGMTRAELAEASGISVRTVARVLPTIARQKKRRNVAGAVLWCIRRDYGEDT